MHLLKREVPRGTGRGESWTGEESGKARGQEHHGVAKTCCCQRRRAKPGWLRAEDTEKEDGGVSDVLGDQLDLAPRGQCF